MENKNTAKKIQLRTMKTNQPNKTFDLKISSKEKNQILVESNGGTKYSEVYHSVDTDTPTFNITLKLGNQLTFVKVCDICNKS